MRPVLYVVGGLLVLYIAYLATLYLFQRRMIFPGQFLPNPDEVVVPGGEILRLPISGGEVEAWYFPAGRSGAPTLLIAHGNFELLDDWLPRMAERPTQFAYLLVEYPGFADSDGAPDQRTTTEALAAGYDWLAARKDRGPIVGFGRSIGGGVICALSRERNLDALILQSTFSRIQRFAARYFAPPALIRDRFDNVAALEQFDGPVLVWHSADDQLMTMDDARMLVAAASGPSELVLGRGSHGESPLDWQSFWAEIERFLASNLMVDAP